LTEAPTVEAPSATGIFPNPVWDKQVAVSPPLPVRERSVVALSLKEQDYSEEIGNAPDPETPEPAASATLDNREMYRIIRAVAAGHSGDDLYSSTVVQEGFGLCFGIALFSQASGHLGSVLRLMQRRDDSSFHDVFGPGADELLTVTNAARREDRLGPVAGDNLGSNDWLARFRQAGSITAFQAAQNEEAIEALFRPILRVSRELGINTDRSLAMVYDRVITRGVGGGLRWVIGAAGPLRTSEQRMSALAALDFDDLKDFQRSTGWVPADGVFGPETHAALVGALRRAEASLLPSASDYMARMVDGADGDVRARLIQLRDSVQFDDVAYAFDNELEN
jgi:hypothetical protein